MSIKLKNDFLSLEINEPGEEYRGARFDWTGQITQITYLNRHTFCTSETSNDQLNKSQGRGLYNEFGLDEAVGYDDCRVGEQFPKIGVGDLRKDSEGKYNFFNDFQIEPYKFSFVVENPSVSFTCTSNSNNIYSFHLEKTIKLKKNSFTINYVLHNNGSRVINTNEYVHNFLAMNYQPISKDYQLIFQYPIFLDKCKEIVNPDDVVNVESKLVTWNQTPKEPFYFSDLQPIKKAAGKWSLVHLKEKVGIMEEIAQGIQKVNLWGNEQVVSPEIFIQLNVSPGKSFSWERTYTLFNLK